VRHLHARAADDEQGAARPEPKSQPDRGAGGPGGQPLPLYRLPEDHRRGGARPGLGGVMLSCSAPVWTPRSLDEALALRAEHPEATVLAGGTDVFVMMEASQLAPTAVLNLWGCP